MGTYGTDARPVDRKSEDLDVLDFSGFLESLTPLFIEFLLQHSMVMISVAHLEILLASRKPTALVEWYFTLDKRLNKQILSPTSYFP